jgi:hypothetical protein
VLPHLLSAHGVRDLADLDPFLDRPRQPADSRSRVQRRGRDQS